ncbi:MAG: branched-chain amino acid ABC transporter permease [Streptosporangiaceae bacterium]
MTKFVELLVDGVSLGFIYALIALGFAVIFKGTEVVNFAHGSVLLAGGYTVARLQGTFGFGPAFAAGIVVAAVLAVVIERLLIRPLHRRGAAPDAMVILTIGVDIMLLTDLTRRIGTNVYGIGGPWGNSVVRAGVFILPEARLWAIIAALILMGAFFAVFKFSGWGVAMRASAEDGEAAALMGIKRGRVAALSWLIAGGLAAVAGVFLTSFPSPGLDNTTGLAALKAFPAAILGGLDSTTGAVAGGLVIGLAETFASGYESHIMFLGRGIGSVMPWIVMLLVLLIRPSGLFGTKAATRV